MPRPIALLALAVCWSVLGCSISDSVGSFPPVPFGGTWNLATVNGASLPYVVQSADPKIELLSDQFIVANSGTFSESGRARLTSLSGEVNNVTFIDAGAWTVSGATVSFRFNGDGSTGTATMNGDYAFTIVGDGISQTYVKQ